jgi:hypothetical protein
MKNSWKIDRRHFLRGLGVSLALPYLEIMGGDSLGTASNPPTRYLTIFHPNGVFPKAWDVDRTGKDYTFSRILSPLEPMRDSMTILSGLDNAAGGDHVAMATSFLTGKVISNKGDFKSVDQYIADKIGTDTLFPSIQLGTEPPRQGSTGAGPISWANTVSWRTSSQRLSPEINPRVAFDRMFRNKTEPEKMKQEGIERKSVLDLAMSDLKSLQHRASQKDKEKLDEFYTSVREVEQGIEKSLNPPKRSWTSPVEPIFMRPPSGIPQDRSEHLKLMIDLMILAFWTDTTRVGTLMTAHGFSRQNFSFLDGVKNDHHGMSHHKFEAVAVEEFTKVSQWYVSQLAYVMKRMSEIDDGRGSMLDNSAILYGSAMKDGNGHIRKNLPLVLAGKGGGKLKTGTHLKSPDNTSIANLHITLLQLFGIETDRINGCGTGTITGLV